VVLLRAALGFVQERERRLTEILPHKKAVQSNYDRESPYYDLRRYGSVGGRYFDQLEKQAVDQFLKGTSILQVGSGSGRFAFHLSQDGNNFVGVEISDGMISEMQRKARKRSLSLDVIQADGEDPPFIPNIFDTILSVRSFHFMAEPMSFLHVAYKLLRPSGRLLVSFELENPLRGLVHAFKIVSEPVLYQSYYSIDDVHRMLRTVGFSILWEGKVTKLPILVYRNTPETLVDILKKFHWRMPDRMGTVGMLVGEKS
jgi:SAM-dependent methyltransferase